MKLREKELKRRLQNTENESLFQIKGLQIKYKEAEEESVKAIKEVTNDYEKLIREFKSEINSLRGMSEKKDKCLEEKDYQIRELKKGMETGNAHVRELQDEVNKYKQNW